MDKTEQAVEKEVNLEKGDDLVIPLKKPINFEGKSHDKIDLNGLHEIKASDMMAVNRRLSRNGNSETNQEFTLEYALNIAHVRHPYLPQALHPDGCGGVRGVGVFHEPVS